MKNITSLTVALLFTALAAGSASAQTGTPQNPTIWGEIAGVAETKADRCVDKKLDDVFNNDVISSALKKETITRTIEGAELQKIKSNCIEQTGEPIERQRFLAASKWTVTGEISSITPAQESLQKNEIIDSCVQKKIDEERSKRPASIRGFPTIRLLSQSKRQDINAACGKETTPPTVWTKADSCAIRAMYESIATKKDGDPGFTYEKPSLLQEFPDNRTQTIILSETEVRDIKNNCEETTGSSIRTASDIKRIEFGHPPKIIRHNP